MKPKDLTGLIFGDLTVLYRVEDHYYPSGRRDIVYKCKCVCGKEIDVLAIHLRSGHTKSCGCFRQKTAHDSRYLHGMTNTRLHNIWKGMRARCTQVQNPCYQLYGGRGITMCNEWEDSFQCFMDWAIRNGYQDNLSIDRIDVNGNYTPENCRWVTQKAQCNNTRRNIVVEYNNESHTLKQWAEVLGLNYRKLHNRMARGWPFEKAISLP